LPGEGAALKDKATVQEDKGLDLSDVSIVSAHSIDTGLLLDFFDAMFPDRAKSLKRLWEWMNRTSFYENRAPLVAIHGGRVVGYSGMMPFAVLLDGTHYLATWSVDYSVLPEFQRRGLGVVLLKEWMKLPHIQLGFANKRAIGACRKAGLGESYASRLHYFLLKPLDHPRFARSLPSSLRSILNALSRPFLTVNYFRYASRADVLKLDSLTEDSLADFATTLSVSKGTVEPVRDMEFLSWRLLDSPGRDEYRILRFENLAAIIRLCDRQRPRYIDLLLVKDESQHAHVRRIISALAMWGMRVGYSYVRYLTTRSALSDHLSRSLLSLVRRPPFVFYAGEPALMQKLRDAAWHWQLIDSDFEVF
jgi:GNAT superfamily N-acetyltransferase